MGNPEPLREELADCGLGLLLRQRFADLVHAFGDGVVISTFEIGDDLASTIVLALRHEEPWRFGNRGCHDQVQDCGNRLEHQHPLPGFEACDLIAITTGRGLEGVVDQLRHGDSENDRQLVHRAETSANRGGGDLRDVGRGDD